MGNFMIPPLLTHDELQGYPNITPRPRNIIPPLLPQVQGQLTPGNINLTDRPRVKNPDGSVSTVRSMSFGQDGREILVPTVASDGSGILSDNEAINQYQRTGQHLGMFDTPENATLYAQQLHLQQEAMSDPRNSIPLNPRPNVGTPPIVQQASQSAQVAPPQTRPVNPQPQIATPQIMQSMPVQQNIPQGNIPITMAQASPAEAGIEQLKAPVYGSPEFHNSKLRTVLNAIAGGLAGASGGPEVGMDVGSRLHDSKYLDAMSRYKGTLADLKEKKNVEEARFGRTEKEMSESRLRDATASLSTYRAGELGLKGEDLDRKKLETQAKIKRQEALNKFTEWKMDPHNAAKGELEYIYTLSPEEQPEALAMLKEIHQSKAKTPEQIEEESKARARGTAEVAVSPLGQQAAAVTSGVKAGAATGAKIQAESTPGALEAQKKVAEAKSEGSTLGRITILGSDFGIKTAKSIKAAQVEASNMLLSANMKDTRSAATAGLEHLPRIYSQIDQMERDGKLGAIMSKWSDFMAGKVGTDAEASRLRFNIGLMDTLLAKAHGGARGGGSPAMMAHFASLLSSKNMDAKTLRATLQEAETWLNTYKNTGKAEPIDTRPELTVEWVK